MRQVMIPGVTPTGTQDVLVILDRSGSMRDAKADHEGGLRQFVEDQQRVRGDVRFTLVQFDSENPCEVVYDRVPIGEVGAVTLHPRGGTPLLDAIGQATAHLGQAHPTSVLCLIVTDGQENSSRGYTKARIRSLIADMEQQGWTFVYLGANVDAFDEAGQLGISGSTTMGYRNAAVDLGGTVQVAYAALSENYRMLRMQTSARSLTLGERRAVMAFTADQRAEADPEGRAIMLGREK